MVAVRDKKTGEILYHQPPYTQAEEDAFYKAVNAPPMRFPSRVFAARPDPAPPPPPPAAPRQPPEPPAAARPSRGRRR
jgi:hypothetical protein